MRETQVFDIHVKSIFNFELQTLYKFVLQRILKKLGTIPSNLFAFFDKYGIIIKLIEFNRQQFYAGVAQLAEQLICNQQVVSSIPVRKRNI